MMIEMIGLGPRERDATWRRIVEKVRRLLSLEVGSCLKLLIVIEIGRRFSHAKR